MPTINPNTKKEETLGGYIVHNLPFPTELDDQALAALKKTAPVQIEQDYAITYLHSYAQDSPFFAGLTNKVMLGNRDSESGYTYATPRGHDMFSGQETEWVVLPKTGKIHAFTICYFGSEEFLPECPFTLVLVEFEGADTLFLGRLVGLDPNDACLDWIGMEVKARFLRNAKLKPTDVYFTPID
ncbi:MAG: OB-fold domain-containing protein [Anaerolineales bacterium]|nr:OB-fold domain-containing protein [Anaerolineales bacterium]